MKTTAPEMVLPILYETYQQLQSASLAGGFKQEAWEICAAAVQEWMARHAPDALGMPPTSGYQWKDVFLPSGTLLRTVFDGKNAHCLVEGDHMNFNGERTSPSGFANAVGRGGRNAWRVIWVLFPNATVWKRADTLRKKRSSRTRTGERSAR